MAIINNEKSDIYLIFLNLLTFYFKYYIINKNKCSEHIRRVSYGKRKAKGS